MSIILSIETATPICSVALHVAGNLVTHTALFKKYSHAECLMTMVDHIFKISKYAPEELAAIAVSHGPGSYTGLRIGASIAKGICYGLNIPLIAVGTLEAMAHGMSPFVEDHTLLCPMIDARRSAVYTLMAHKTGKIERPAHVAFLDDADYIASFGNHSILFFGEGVLKCKPLMPPNTNIRFLEQGAASAIHIGSLAFLKLQKQLVEELDVYTPCYLSQFLTI